MYTTISEGAHILMIPFPPSGHIIPMLDLTHQFLTRGLTITVLITPNNHSLLQPLLSLHPHSLHSLLLSPPNGDPFMNQPKSLDDFIANMHDFSELCTPVVNWFKSHDSPPVAVVSDCLFGWTYDMTCELGVPRVSFSSSGLYASCVSDYIWRHKPRKSEDADDDFLVCFDGVVNSPACPWWQLSHIYRGFKDGHADWEFYRDGLNANSMSWGFVFNSFAELERVYIEHLVKEMGHDRVWAVGPLLPSGDDLPRGGSNSVPTHEVMTWLDQRLDQSVVYVCFGSRVVLPDKEMDVLTEGLKASGVHFILSVKEMDEDRCNDLTNTDAKGFVIRGWAPQVAILRHKAVGAFVTHCGWNSVLEGISAGVVMLTWPMDADQFTSASLLVDELGVGIQVGEGTRNVPEPNELARILGESLDVSRPERVRAAELSCAAMCAVKGGSSERDLDDLVKRLSELKRGEKSI